MSSTVNPSTGNVSPTGGSNFTRSPFEATKVSVSGLKHKSPAMAKAMAISGEATKACVFGLPSARLAKFRLNEVTMEFGRAGSSVSRFHWPIQGPQAFVIITPPTASKSAIIPSRFRVQYTCSEPGLMISGAAIFNPLALT